MKEDLIAPSEMFFLSLASGSSGNCYYIGSHDYGILIDVGISMRDLKRKLSANKIEISKIMGVFVTHDHYDHIHSALAISEVYHIPIYASSKVFEGIKNNEKIRKKIAPINVRYIENGGTVNLREYKITAFSLPHDASDNQGYVVEVGGFYFTFATDFGEATEELCKNISKSDFLMLESNHDESMLLDGRYPQVLKQRILSRVGHLSNKKAAKLLQLYASERLRHVFLCHLSKDNNTPELAFAESRSVLPESVSLSVLPRTEAFVVSLTGGA